MQNEFPMSRSAYNRTVAQLQEDAWKMRSPEQTQFIREIAAGLAHEIMNPIAGIKGALEIFLRELDLSPENRAVFEEMLFQVRKLDVITKGFLEYARPPSPQRIQVNIHDIIQDTLALLTRYGMHKNIRNVSVVREFDESLPFINADPMQLQQVFLNLTLNALDAMNDGGTLTYKTANRGDIVEIEVWDTGHGLGKEITDKIFQPFFTTRTRGFGVGLSVSKRLVEQHGGEITVESRDSGTVFRVSLPVTGVACLNGLNRT